MSRRKFDLPAISIQDESDRRGGIGKTLREGREVERGHKTIFFHRKVFYRGEKVQIKK